MINPPSARIALAGATGYAGQELLRLLAGHPHVRVTAAMASGTEARRLPALARIWDDEIQPLDVDRLADGADIVCLALPEHASAALGPALAARGVRLVDLSGAFRLRDRDTRARWYPDAAVLPGGTVYGLALLPLLPLAARGLLDGDVIIDAKSGVSGAGKSPTERTHFSEVHGSLAAYGVFAHRHAAEMEQELGRPVTFVPHLVPINRGILETIYVRVRAGATAADVQSALEDAYRDAPFVRLSGPALPEIKHVAFTNFCDIGWRLDGDSGRLVIVSCIDNLMKGAAGQAVQNINLMSGLDERAGLWR